MGLFDLLKGSIGGKKSKKRPRVKTKCPKCGGVVYTDSERCPKCGTHIDLMFRINRCVFTTDTDKVAIFDGTNDSDVNIDLLDYFSFEPIEERNESFPHINFLLMENLDSEKM